MPEIDSEQKLRSRRVRRWQKRVEDQMEELEILAQTKFPDSRKGFTVGMSHSLALFHRGSLRWEKLTEIKRNEFLEGVGFGLGVDILNYLPSQVLRQYREEGVPGSRREKGWNVDELATKFPRWNVKVAIPIDPAYFKEYDILRVSIIRWSKPKNSTKNTAHGGIS